MFTKFLAGASLLMSFHLGGHCRQGYDVTRSRFLAGCTRRLPGILVYHHPHQPAAWTKIVKLVEATVPLVLRAHFWTTVFVSVEFNKKCEDGVLGSWLVFTSRYFISLLLLSLEFHLLVTSNLYRIVGSTSVCCCIDNLLVYSWITGTQIIVRLRCCWWACPSCFR